MAKRQLSCCLPHEPTVPIIISSSAQTIPYIWNLKVYIRELKQNPEQNPEQLERGSLWSYDRKDGLTLLLTAWLWATHVFARSFSYLICKMGLKILTVSHMRYVQLFCKLWSARQVKGNSFIFFIFLLVFSLILSGLIRKSQTIIMTYVSW